MKIFTRDLLPLAAAAALVLSPSMVRAELLMSDNFEYSAGPLYNNGGWIKMTTNTNEPIQVVAGSLTYDGYQATAVGNSVKLDGNGDSKSQRLQKPFADAGVTLGTLFYSLLVKPTAVPQSNSSKYIIAGFSGKNYSGFGDGVGNTTPYAAVSLTKGSTDGKFKFGIAAAASTPTLVKAEYDLGETYLVVVKYDFSTKDISLWINPAKASDDPTCTLAGGGTISTTNGVQGLCLYQQGSSLALATAIVDAVKVSTSIDDLFEEGGENPGGGETPGGGDDPELNPTVTVSQTVADFGQIFQNMSVEQEFTLTATDLSSDLTLTSSNADFKVAPATISAADAMAGTAFTITFKPSAANMQISGVVSIKEGDNELAKVTCRGAAIAVTTMPSYAFLSNAIFEGDAEDGTYYYLSSKNGTVTQVDPTNNRFFIQDIAGALEVSCDFVDDLPVNLNDTFQKFYALYYEGGLYLIHYDEEDIVPGSPKEALECTLSDLLSQPESYWNKLVAISDELTFDNAGLKFAASSTAGKDDKGNQVNVRPFNDSNIVNTIIPKKAKVSGIAVSKSGNVIWPRQLNDLTILEEGTSGIEGVTINEPTDTRIYDLRGVSVPQGVKLPAGVYIVNGKKSYIK